MHQGEFQIAISASLHPARHRRRLCLNIGLVLFHGVLAPVACRKIGTKYAVSRPVAAIALTLHIKTNTAPATAHRKQSFSEKSANYLKYYFILTQIPPIVLLPYPQRCPIQVIIVAPSTIVDSPSISPTNAANALLNLTFPKPTGIRSLPLVKPHETDLNCLPPGYELFSTNGSIYANTGVFQSVIRISSLS